MVESAERNPRVEVFTKSVEHRFTYSRYANMEDSITRGVAVGVALDGEVVWEKDVYPIFVGIRLGSSIQVPRPRYAQRIEAAEKRARQVAAATNFINSPKE
jgi:hypothetical protein